MRERNQKIEIVVLGQIKRCWCHISLHYAATPDMCWRVNVILQAGVNFALVLCLLHCFQGSSDPNDQPASLVSEHLGQQHA